jgi:predicted membrane protein
MFNLFYFIGIIVGLGLIAFSLFSFKTDKKEKVSKETTKQKDCKNINQNERTRMGLFEKEVIVSVLSDQAHYNNGHNTVFFESVIITSGEKTIDIGVVHRGSYKKRHKLLSLDRETWKELIQQWLYEAVERNEKETKKV